MEWWQIVLTVIGAIMFGAAILLGVVRLLMFLFWEEQHQDESAPEAKRLNWHTEARDIAVEHGVQKPPDKYCPKCGTKLNWYYARAKKLDRDTDTGKEVYWILVRYKCPNKHFAGPPENGMVTWTNSNYWKWAL